MIFERRFEMQTEGLVCGPASFDEDLYNPKYLKQPLVQKRGRLVLADPRPSLWQPVTVHSKVVIRSREGGEILWQRPFSSRDEALVVYLRLTGLDLGRMGGKPWHCPSVWLDGELEYYIATVATYNSTLNDSVNDWAAGGTKCPTGVTASDYLLVAGGASGSTDGTGGGGAGGVLSGSGSSVTAGTNYPVTIGAGGASKTAGSAAVGNDGNNSTWNSLTALKGGGGGYTGNGTGGSSTYGSGGGAGRSAGYTGGAGTAGQGNNGGNTSGDNQGSGGGGGAGAVGSNGTSSSAGGAGGNGTASSISGSSVTYGGGGGAGAQSGGNAAGGSGGGGAAGNPGTAGTDNLGGGGGAGSSAGGASGAGGTGVCILSWTASVAFIPPNLAMLGM